jgi:hypothetical protein
MKGDCDYVHKWVSFRLYMHAYYYRHKCTTTSSRFLPSSTLRCDRYVSCSHRGSSTLGYDAPLSTLKCFFVVLRCSSLPMVGACAAAPLPPVAGPSSSSCRHKTSTTRRRRRGDSNSLQELRCHIVGCPGGSAATVKSNLCNDSTTGRAMRAMRSMGVGQATGPTDSGRRRRGQSLNIETARPHGKPFHVAAQRLQRQRRRRCGQRCGSCGDF